MKSACLANAFLVIFPLCGAFPFLWFTVAFLRRMPEGRIPVVELNGGSTE
jgi:hypothetical protein